MCKYAYQCKVASKHVSCAVQINVPNIRQEGDRCHLRQSGALCSIKQNELCSIK